MWPRVASRTTPTWFPVEGVTSLTLLNGGNYLKPPCIAHFATLFQSRRWIALSQKFLCSRSVQSVYRCRLVHCFWLTEDLHYLPVILTGKIFALYFTPRLKSPKIDKQRASFIHSLWLFYIIPFAFCATVHITYQFMESMMGQFCILLALANKGGIKNGFLRGVGCTLSIRGIFLLWRVPSSTSPRVLQNWQIKGVCEVGKITLGIEYVLLSGGGGGGGGVNLRRKQQ